MLPPDGGDLRVLGRHPHDAEDRLAIRRRLGYLPQDARFHRAFTAFEALDYVAVLKEHTATRARHEEVRRVLELVGLSDVAARKVRTLSGGMRRRLGLAQALIDRPDLLVLDEPTVGLEALGLGVSGLVLAATVRTWRGQLEPSYVAVVVSGALPRRWALVQDPTWGPPWEAALLRWAGVLLAALSLLTMLLRDPLARLSGTAAGTWATAGSGEPAGRDGTVLGECPHAPNPGGHVEAQGDDRLEAARRELAAVREELARAQEHLVLFAGQVSHELRTPLTAILANAEMLAAEPVLSASEDAAWMVQGVTRAAHRLSAMIDHMVDYAREGGAVSMSVVDLGPVFEAAVQDLAPVVAEREAVVKLGDLPRLPADRDQMYAVALNLLSNACKFSRAGTPPEVVVSAERRGDRWRVEVSDNGVGVAPERREAMFVLFARADKRVEGAGIGLAVARRIVEAHGGRIGMDAGEPCGTTVWFELPA